MITIDDYKKIFNDDIEKREFDSLLYHASSTLQAYCESFISKFKLKDTFEEYDLDIDDAILDQIHFSYINGGIDMYFGQSDLNLTSVQTSGFTYNYSNNNAQLRVFNGIPISPLSAVKIENELTKKGYMDRCIYA